MKKIIKEVVGIFKCYICYDESDEKYYKFIKKDTLEKYSKFVSVQDHDISEFEPTDEEADKF